MIYMRIVIDGNIGSGKSTQLDLLKQFGWVVWPEQVSKWPLTEFYQDPKGWALPLQRKVLETMHDLGNGIYERCPATSGMVFWKQLILDGTVDPPTDERYKEVYAKMGWSPDLFVLIDTPVQACFERITQGKRTQPGDDVIDPAYLAKLKERYEEMWDHIDCPKVRIDGSQSPHEIHRQICEFIVHAKM